ncbi:hypothetical protein LDENG_00110770 [Lucifuga dentata]|nr:hypothetical protein LDENG_00110770 [Lucifuga dentata]
MSSRAESKTDSQRFQFVSLTLRLKDKLHPPRVRQIKQPPTHRDTPTEAELQSVCVFVEQERAVLSSLQYFKALVDRVGVEGPCVDKLVLDQSVVGSLLGGASGQVLEAVQTLVQLEPHLHSSKSVSSCLARLYRSLAQLIRWADQVMLQGVAPDNKKATTSITTVIRAMLGGVKELARLAAERQDSSSPSTSVQSQPAMAQLREFDNQKTLEIQTCPAPPEEDPSAPAKPPRLLPQISFPPNQMTDTLR